MKRNRINFCFLFVSILVMSMFTMPFKVTAAEVPKYHNIPAYQQRDIFETETVTIAGIKVEELINGVAQSIERPIEFKIFNTVKQEIEGTVYSENGVLQTMNLIKNHNYMIYTTDSEYIMKPAVFGWVKDGKLLNIKKM